MAQRSVSAILVGLCLIISGCASVPKYLSPGPEAPHATLAFIKPETFSFLYDTGEIMVFDQPDCLPLDEGRLLTQIFYSTPEPVRIFADTPIFLRVATVRYGSTLNFACVNVTRLQPRAGQRYEVVQQFAPNECEVRVRDGSGGDSPDAERIPVRDSCTLPGWNDPVAVKAVKP